MIKTVKLVNTMDRTYNGVKPNGTINVEEKDVSGYLAEGFAEISADMEAKREKEALEADAKLKEEQEEESTRLSEEEAERKRQEEQDKLDEEHENGKTDETGGEEDESVDLGDQDVAGNSKALNAELNTVATKKKNK